MNKFQVGDIVKGVETDKYYITNEKMTKGEVIEVHGDGKFDVVVVEHHDSSLVGEKCRYVQEEYFVMVQKLVVIESFEIKEEATGTYIIINNKYTLFTTATKEEISIINVEDIEKNIATAKMLALSNIK